MVMRGVGDARELPHRQIERRGQPDQQDQQADDGGQHRPTNEDSVKDMRPLRYCLGRSAAPDQRLGVVDANAGAGIELELARRHHLLASLDAGQDGDAILAHLLRS